MEFDTPSPQPPPYLLPRHPLSNSDKMMDEEETPCPRCGNTTNKDRCPECGTCLTCTL